MVSAESEIKFKETMDKSVWHDETNSTAILAITTYFGLLAKENKTYICSRVGEIKLHKIIFLKIKGEQGKFPKSIHSCQQKCSLTHHGDITDLVALVCF